MVTRPLRRLSQAVAAVAREGLDAGAPGTLPGAWPQAEPSDEFGQLSQGFRSMLDALRRQWEALRRLDHFRREGVSNLSHDLRSPLTATAACLETLDARFAGDAARADDRQLLEVALRNTRNAARLVQSLGDLAQLDEPQFALKRETLDVGELLDDIALRFEPRAAAQGVALAAGAGAATRRPWPSLDIELFERAIANLVDNALKFCAAGGRITLRRACATATRCRSAWPTPAPASPRPTCRTCSTASTRRGRAWRRPPAKAARAWAWRSSSASPSCTAAAWRCNSRLGPGHDGDAVAAGGLSRAQVALAAAENQCTAGACLPRRRACFSRPCAPQHRRLEPRAAGRAERPATLVLAFGAQRIRRQPQALRRAGPGAARCRASGLLHLGRDRRHKVYDASISVAVARLQAHRACAMRVVDVQGPADSWQAGARLGRQLQGEDLRAVFVLSDGLGVNGTPLLAGLTQHLPAGVAISGGLAGDGSRFIRTWVLDAAQAGAAAHLRRRLLRSSALRVGHGYDGGWSDFGPERRITRSEGNVLYELDGKPALDLYKAYLGDRAAGLPGTALLFPLSLRRKGGSGEPVVRTILGIDEQRRSMTFAGDMPARRHGPADARQQ